MSTVIEPNDDPKVMISELISYLEEVRARYGELEVVVERDDCYDAPNLMKPVEKIDEVLGTVIL